MTLLTLSESTLWSARARFIKLHSWVPLFQTICHSVLWCISLPKVKNNFFNFNLDWFLCQEYYSLAFSWHQSNRQKDKRDDVEGMHSEAGVKIILTISRPVSNNIFKYPIPFLTFIRVIFILSLQRRCVVQRICEA